MLEGRGPKGGGLAVRGDGEMVRVEQNEGPSIQAITGKEAEALEIAKGWRDRVHTAWMDGSRIERGGVGVAAVWWQRAHTSPPWSHPDRARTMRPGGPFRPPYHPRRVADGWTEQRFHLGKNKEVCYAELFAIYRALKIFLERHEQGATYTIPSNSQAAIERALSDRSCPGLALAKAIVEPERLLSERGCSATTKWIPAHKGIGKRGSR